MRVVLRLIGLVLLGVATGFLVALIIPRRNGLNQ